MFRCIKGLIVTVVFATTITGVEAQAYKPLLATFNEWHVTDCFFGCLTDVYFTDEVKTVNGYDYSVLDGFHYINRTFLLREDTTEKQVFFLTTGIGKEDLEYLLYDFSLQPGDSMPIFNPISPLPDSAGYFILDSIVPEILIDGDTYRHFYLSALDSAKSVTGRAEWIEGIGSLNLINTPGAYGDINNGGALSCFFNSQTLHYSNLDSIVGCVQQYPNLSVDQLLQNELIIFPNPASSALQISLGTKKINKVCIFNMLGQEVRTFQNISPSNFNGDISTLPAGTFILKLWTENGQEFVEKLMVK